jgi:hypothetical protein
MSKYENSIKRNLQLKLFKNMLIFLIRQNQQLLENLSKEYEGE